jgi:hypothetical protein
MIQSLRSIEVMQQEKIIPSAIAFTDDNHRNQSSGRMPWRKPACHITPEHDRIVCIYVDIRIGAAMKLRHRRCSVPPVGARSHPYVVRDNLIAANCRF